ncbi:hypothetical protein ATCC90586_004603 [Pythium insidiosum]|nr:hypothetical protein ATCC90586_004603 [Pythium insidiosum]
MVVRLQCAFRMRLARRRVYQRKIDLGLIPNDGSATAVRPWVEVYDPFHKVLYYYCASTGETRWDPPEVFISAAEDREMAAAIAIQSLARSHLARRELKQRRATLRRRQHEKAMEETRRLREIRRREYFAKTDDERESICRRELLDEEMEQIGHGDLFWGRDRYEQEVLRQLAEEKLLADAEAFWQRVNATLRQRSEMERHRSLEEEASRQEADLMAEANERDAMAMAEHEQCQLGDGFWGIQAEEKREEQTRHDLDLEEELSREFGAHARVEDLHHEWAAEAERLEVLAQSTKVLNEKKFQRQYFKWFYHNCLTAEQVLDYVWPTMQRFVPPAPTPATALSKPPPSLPDILILDGTPQDDTLLNDFLDELISSRSAVAGATPAETPRSATSHESAEASTALSTTSTTTGATPQPAAPLASTPSLSGRLLPNAEDGSIAPVAASEDGSVPVQPPQDETADDTVSTTASRHSQEKAVPPQQQRPATIAYVLDDIVLRHRLQNEFMFSGRSILTVHDAQQARILGRRGRFDVSRIATEPPFLAAAKQADKMPRPTSPRRPMPESSKAPKPRDQEPTDERESDERWSGHHLRSSLPYQRAKTPDPHLPARYNGVPFNDSEISAAHEILSAKHVRHTQLPALALPWGGASSPTGLGAAIRHASVQPLVLSSMAFASPFAHELHHQAPLHTILDREKGEGDGGASDSDVSPSRHEVSPAKPPSKPKESPAERAARLAEKREARMRHRFANRFRREELETVEQVFHLMDADDSGTISKREMVWALQHDGEIHAVARRSALLRLLLKQHDHLETLFAHLKMSESRRDELSWDIFRVFCEEMYIRLMEQGLLDMVAQEEAEDDAMGSGQSKQKKSRAKKKKKHRRELEGIESPQQEKARPGNRKSSFVESKEESLIRRIFQQCDHDKNGFLHVEELRKALYKSPSVEIRTVLRASKALQPLLHQDTFVQAFCRFEPADPRGISEEEFVLFCLETAEIAALNDML